MDMDYEIVKVRGREILDSRGNPTVEAEVELESCESLQMTLRDGVTFCYEDHRAVLDLGKAGSGCREPV